MIYQTSFDNNTFMGSSKILYRFTVIIKEPIKYSIHSIPEKILVSIIQNDNLQTSKVQVWEYVHKWRLVQNPELLTGVLNYLQYFKEHITTMYSIY